MFNSQKINNDPYPYVSESGTRHANPGWLNSEYFSNRRERAEYDNDPNPILVAFREDTKPHAGSWLSCLEDPHRERVFGPQEWSREHIDHAKRVLEKLVNAYE